MILERMNKKFEKYRFEIIYEGNSDDVLLIMGKNTYYYSVTQNHEITRQECIDDILEIPPGIGCDKKTYVLIYSKDKPIGLIDFVEGYPKKNIGYLGLLMIDGTLHGSGVGRELILGVFEIARDIGLTMIELACYEKNSRALKFWKKVGFQEIRRSMREVDGEERQLISMKFDLKESR